MRKQKNNSIIRNRGVWVITLLVAFLFCAPTNADFMQSASFRVTSDDISIGGGKAVSGSYIVEDTLGELATGEGLASASFIGCSGFQCYTSAPYLAFSVKVGLARPGVAGDPVDLGLLSRTAVTTSDGITIKSGFINVESSASGGVIVTVRSDNGGLARVSAPTVKVVSTTESLVAGNEGYGVCVEAVRQGAESPTSLSKVFPYNGTCNKIAGHDVGAVQTTAQNLVSTTGELADGEADILIKASIASESPAGSDYGDNLTFIATGTF